MDQEDDCGCELCHMRSIRSVSSEANGKECPDRNNENTINISPTDSVPSAPNSMPASQGQLANLHVGEKWMIEVLVDLELTEENILGEYVWVGMSGSFLDASCRQEWFRMRTFDVREGAASGTGVRKDSNEGQKAGGGNSTSCWSWWLKAKANKG